MDNGTDQEFLGDTQTVELIWDFLADSHIQAVEPIMGF